MFNSVCGLAISTALRVWSFLNEWQRTPNSYPLTVEGWSELIWGVTSKCKDSHVMQQFPTEPPRAMHEAEVTVAFPCRTQCRAGGHVLGPHLLPSASLVLWDPPSLCLAIVSPLSLCLLPSSGSSTGTLVPPKLGRAALSRHFHMIKWAHLKPERAFSGFSSLTAFQKSYCLPL